MGFTQQITDQLQAQLDAARVKRRNDGRGGGLSYLEGYDVIDTLNRIFGFDGWHMTTRRVDYFPNVGQNGAYMAIVAVSVGDMGIGVAREDVGLGIVQGSSAEGHETAVKAAVTDAMKRASRTFGNQFGNSLYDKASPHHNGGAAPSPFRTNGSAAGASAGNSAGRQEGTSGRAPSNAQPASGGAAGGISDKQVNFAYRLGKDAGLDRAAVDALASARFGVGLAQLGKRDASAFIDELKARAEAQQAGDDSGADDAPF